jgi:hypothetical protein
MLRTAVLPLLLLTFSVAIKADELPDKPHALVVVTPMKSLNPKVVNREFLMDVSAVVVGWTLDGISTHVVFEHHHYEIGYFFPGTESTWKPQLAWAGVDVAAVVLGYEWKKRVHNRFLNPLWRAPILDRAAEHTQAAVHNWRIKLSP